MLARISAQQRSSVPVLSLPGPFPVHEAGDALGRTAPSSCEDDRLHEIVQVTLLMTEIISSSQSQNLEEVTARPVNIGSCPELCQKSVSASKGGNDSVESRHFGSAIKSSPNNLDIKCLEREGWLVKEGLVIPRKATMKMSGVWK